MKSSKKALSFFLALVTLFQVFVSSAVASDSNIATYNFDNLLINISYTLEQDTVQEKIEICEGDALTTIKKIVSVDGTMKVFIDNELYEIHENVDYIAFLNAAEETLFIPQTYSVNSQYPCGFDATHDFVSQNQETIDLTRRDLYESVLVTMILSALEGPSGAIVGSVYTMAKYILNSGAQYLDITELKFYVHDSNPPLDMNCFHVHMRAYNITTNNKKDVVKDYWEYYQYVL